MKIKIAIIGGIILVAIIFAGMSVPAPVSDFSPMFGDKYQYTFGEITIKNEKDQQFDRVFFSYSHNFGKTFSELQDISMSENTWTGEAKMILMDEDVILVWREEISPSHTLAFATSDNYGKNLEKQYLWVGSRPDIVHYDNVLYLTWVDLETRQVSYTTSNNKGETFEEHKVIFTPTNEFSPYALKPEPKFVIENNTVKIVWNSSELIRGDPQNFEFIIGQDEPLSKSESKGPSGKPSMPPVLVSTNGIGHVTIWPNSFLSVEVMCPMDNPYPSNYQILFDKVPYDTKVHGVKQVSGVRDGTEYNGFIFDFENPTNESESATIQVNCDVTLEPRTEPETEPELENEK